MTNPNQKEITHSATETFDKHVFLKGLHTKQLIQLRDKIYKVPKSYDPVPMATSEEEDYAQMCAAIPQYDVSDAFKGHYVSLIDVKRELSTREHVPNKAEAKEIRQQRAKQKMR